MKKFLISKDLSQVLDKQQTQLMVTTTVSAIGLVFVWVANLVTLNEDGILELVEEAMASEESEN